MAQGFESDHDVERLSGDRLLDRAATVTRPTRPGARTGVEAAYPLWQAGVARWPGRKAEGAIIESQDRLESPALLIVDMQNDFVRLGAPLEVPDARATIELHRALIAAFRASGHAIVYTKFITTPYRSLLWNWSPECEPDIKCCWKGHQRTYEDSNEALECTDVIREIYPEPGDLIVEKFGYGAFHGTPLADMLHSLNVRSVVVTGTVTQICVEETAREAFHHGFRTTLVEDAVSSFAPNLHAATLENFAMKFGWVSSSHDLLARIGEA